MDTPKKRAPLEQLREAGRMARQMLVDKGILAKESVIDQIVKDSRAPTLPGIPAYLPHEWTLRAAQRIMRDLVVIWKEETKGKKKQRENITEFWKFVLSNLRAQEEAFATEKKAMPAKIAEMEKKIGEVLVLKEVFSPMRKEENLKAIQHFLVDSFAVAIVVKQHHSVGEYLNWFLDWTQELHLLWVKPSKRKDVKRV